MRKTPTDVSESDLRAQLAREGLNPERWSNGPHAVYAAHEHPYTKVLMVVSGSITFTVAGGRVVPMQPGDRLDLPAHTSHSALVGSHGVVCLEAHQDS